MIYVTDLHIQLISSTPCPQRRFLPIQNPYSQFIWVNNGQREKEEFLMRVEWWVLRNKSLLFGFNRKLIVLCKIAYKRHWIIFYVKQVKQTYNETRSKVLLENFIKTIGAFLLDIKKHDLDLIDAKRSQAMCNDSIVCIYAGGNSGRVKI